MFPLKGMVGRANEVSLSVNGRQVTALLGTGSMLSTIAQSLCKSLGLEAQPLDGILKLVGVGGHPLPYALLF